MTDSLALSLKNGMNATETVCPCCERPMGTVAAGAVHAYRCSGCDGLTYAPGVPSLCARCGPRAPRTAPALAALGLPAPDGWTLETPDALIPPRVAALAPCRPCQMAPEAARLAPLRETTPGGTPVAFVRVLELVKDETPSNPTKYRAVFPWDVLTWGLFDEETNKEVPVLHGQRVNLSTGKAVIEFDGVEGWVCVKWPFPDCPEISFVKELPR